MAKDKLPAIRTRRELFDFLEQQMSQSFEHHLEKGNFLSDNKFLKSFIFEFDWNPKELPVAESQFLRDSLTIQPIRKNSSPIVPFVQETDEEGFYQVMWNWRHRHQLKLFLDTSSDPSRRFWLGYSLSDAADLDIAIERITRQVPAFDRAWFWPDFLTSIQEQGEFRGIGVDYDYRRFEAKEGRTDSTNYIKMQLVGGPETRQILEFMQHQEQFQQRIVLAKIRMKYWEDKNIKNMFSIEDIKFNGKFTSRGTSFACHQALFSGVRGRYASKILDIESRHTIRATSEDWRDGIEGDPVFFEMGLCPIDNLDAFCEVVFSGSAPFRIWGVPEVDCGHSNTRSVIAVDLHTGSKLFFEIYHDVICMYLYPGACGNTVARFFTNLQHTFNSLVRATSNDRQPVF